MSEPPLMPPCLVCGRVLGRTFPMGAVPSGGTAFEGHGGYGSAVFDPMDAYQSLAVNVCDPCLTAAGGQGRVALLTRPEPERREPDAAAWTAGG